MSISGGQSSALPANAMMLARTDVPHWHRSEPLTLTAVPWLFAAPTEEHRLFVEWAYRLRARHFDRVGWDVPAWFWGPYLVPSIVFWLAVSFLLMVTVEILDAVIGR